MSLAKIILSLVVVGASMWAVNTYTPATPAVKAVVNAGLVALLCLWLLHTFGVIDGIKSAWLR